MDQLYTPGKIRQIREKYGIKLSKSLGQNFLADKNIIDKIIEGSLISDEDLVIEIGPGIGVLTQELAQKAKKVIAIEIDKNLIPMTTISGCEKKSITSFLLRVIIEIDTGYIKHWEINASLFDPH